MEEYAPAVVVNCAAYGVDNRDQEPLRAVAVNVAAPAALFLEADAHGAAFVHIGTSYEYGSHEGPISESTPLRPIGVYGATKAAGSLLLAALAPRAARRPLIVRCFGLYGPREGTHKLVPQILRAKRRQEPLALTSGTQVRDYMFVGDAARFIAELACADPATWPDGGIVNLCSGQAVTVEQFARSVAAAIGAEELLEFGKNPERANEAARVVGDPSRFRAWCERTGRSKLATIAPVADAVGAMMESA